jgi:hypothetical protein
MGAPRQRYVAKAVPGSGWRVWDRKRICWWGNYFAAYPDALVVELNGPKRPDRITELSRGSYVPPQYE